MTRRREPVFCRSVQHAIRVLIPLAVVLNLGLLFTIILARPDRLSLYLLIAASFCIMWAALITVFGNWPINTITTWSINSPPSNWTKLRVEWWRFHVARAVIHKLVGLPNTVGAGSATYRSKKGLIELRL